MRALDFSTRQVCLPNWPQGGPLGGVRGDNRFGRSVVQFAITTILLAAVIAGLVLLHDALGWR